MNTEERFKKDIWWLLQELRKDEMSITRDQHIRFEYITSKDSPTIADQHRIIRFLTGAIAVKISSDIFPAPFDQATGSIGAKVYGIKPIGHFLDLIQPAFNELYELFETTVAEKIKDNSFAQSLSKQKTSEQKLVCVLNVIKEEFELGTNSGWIDIPASDFSTCGTDRDKLSRIISKFTNEKIIDKFIFIDGNEAKYEEEYEYDVYRLFLPTDFSIRANEFALSVLSLSGYSKLKELNNNLEDKESQEIPTKKIIHEHTHRFKNSIQEKDIILNVKNTDENIISKSSGKKVTLQQFPRTDWLKVSITFLDETNILLSDSKSTKPSSFKGMGCEDGRNGKADVNWAFLLNLAKGNGQTLSITKKQREREKKQKQKVTDILRKIFQNDTDPFETESGGVYKAKFNIKYNTDEKEKPNHKYSDSEEVFSEMTAPIKEDMSDDFSQ